MSSAAENAGLPFRPSPSATGRISPTSAGKPPTAPLNLCRLRYIGSPDKWGFGCYLASKDGYEDSVLPTGSFTGSPEDALDCVCGLYLNDPSAWLETNSESQDNSLRNL